MLTGGKTAKEIYKLWASSTKFNSLSNIDFYLTDERCVSIDNPMSNAGMIKRTLFQNGLPSNCNFYFPIKNDLNITKQVLRYEKKIPRKIDFIILSVGDDGHIASIFTDGDAASEKTRYFMESTSPVKPKKRVTLTFPAILNAKKIFILAVTERKKNILEFIKKNESRFDNIPVKKVIHGDWIVESNINKAANILLNKILLSINQV